MQEGTLTRLIEAMELAGDLTVADTLIRTAAIIRQRGWRQGGGSGDGPVCVVIALCLASHGQAYPPPPGPKSKAFNEAFWHLSHLVGERHGTAVFSWNDRPDTTQASVLEMLEHAANQARRR